MVDDDSVRGVHRPVARTVVDSSRRLVCQPEVATLTLRELAGNAPASLAALARQRQAQYGTAAAAPLARAVSDPFARLVNNSAIRAARDTAAADEYTVIAASAQAAIT